MGRFDELKVEFSTISANQGSWLDAAVGPIAFGIAAAFTETRPAALIAIIPSLLIASWRLARRQPVQYALGGVGAIAIAAGFAYFSDSDAGFFLPGIVSAVLTATIALGSVLAGKPMTAWTSFFTRGWPIDWYWHPQVKPAYVETTVAWAIYFAARAIVQWQSLDAGTTVATTVKLATGWPSTLALLVATYLYGSARLRRLAGPSVDEHANAVPPPWSSQQTGF